MSTIKYDTLAVFAGPNRITGNYASGDIAQLHRIQSANYSIEIQRENQAALGTANANEQVFQSPIVNLTLDYLVADGENEKNLGLVVDGLHGSLVDANSGVKDYFLLIEDEDKDKMTLAFGNCVLSRYSVNGSVGDFLKASAEIKGFNVKLDNGISGYVPNVDPLGNPNSLYTYALPPVMNGVQERADGYVESNVYIAPRNLNISFPNNSAFGMILNGAGKSHAQSFSLNLQLDRTEMAKIGTKYPFKRCLQLPLELTLSTEMFVSKYVADDVQNYLCQDSHDIEVDVTSSKCSQIDELWDEVSNITKLKYIFKGLKLRSVQTEVSTNDRKRVTIDWAVRIGHLLDLKKNFFISGNFGRYTFPPIAYSDVTGETSVTGYGLQPFTRQTLFKRTLGDVVYPDFFLDFSGDFDIHPEDVYLGESWYRGDSGVRDIGGQFGQDITVSDFVWNSDSYSTAYNGVPQSGFAKNFGTFDSQYFIGFSGNQDLRAEDAYFYIKGEGMNSTEVALTVADLPPFVSGGFLYPKCSMSAYEPYFFNRLSIGITDPSIEFGTPFDFKVIASTPTIKKIYNISAVTPDNSYHVTLPRRYSGRASLWIEPYVPSNVVWNENGITDLYDASARHTHFTGEYVFSPKYVQSGQNNKSYIHMDSFSHLFMHHGTGFTHDFRNFTLFTLTNPSGSIQSDATILEYAGLMSGAAGHFKLQRYSITDDLVFSYANNLGVSQPVFVVPSGVVTGQWTLNCLYYDGSVIKGRTNGTGISTPSGFVSGVNMNITGSNIFNEVQMGGHGSYRGALAELILFPYRLSDSEIINVESYLKYKWGV